MYFQIIICAFGGGALRGLIGFIKYQFSYKNVSFNIPYFLGMTSISGIVGMMAAISIKELGFTLFDQFSPALSFIVGYAGGDFLENIYKIITAKGVIKDIKSPLLK